MHNTQELLEIMGILMRNAKKLVTLLLTKLLCFLLLLSLSQQVRADSTYMVKDLTPIGDLLIPQDFTVFGDIALMSGDDGVPYYRPLHGRELWMYDFNTKQSVLVKDGIPGSGGYSRLFKFTKSGSKYFYTSVAGDLTKSFWATDLTDAGTQRLNASSAPDKCFSISTGCAYVVFPYASDLWFSDGTQAGTQVIAAGKVSEMLGVINNRVFFAGISAANGIELWSSDGTIVGTGIFKEFYPGANSSAPSFVASIGNTAYIQVKTAYNNYELWKSDGTLGGTVLVKSLGSNYIGSGPARTRVIGNNLYFLMGGDLWISDGTAVGTQILKTFTWPTIIGATANNAIIMERSALRELWTSNGTALGTVQLKIFPANSTLTEVVSSQSRSFISVSNGTQNQNQIWMTDGTVVGTLLVQNANWWSGIAVGEKVIACSLPDDWNQGERIVVFDGQLPVTTREVIGCSRQIQGADPEDPESWSNVPEQLFVRNAEAFMIHGARLLRFTGQALLPVEESPLDAPGTSDYFGSYPENFNKHGNDQIFTARDGIYRTTGAQGDVTKVLDDLLLQNPTLKVHGDSLKYISNLKGTYEGSNTYAGPQAVRRLSLLTNQVETLGQVTFGSAYSPVISDIINDHYIFPDTYSSSGIWRMNDGGIEKISEVSPWPDNEPRFLVKTQAMGFFLGLTSANGLELWRTDGTSAGTALVKDLAPGSQNGVETVGTAINGKVLFVDKDSALFVSDGSESGTMSISGGPTPFRYPLSFVNSGNYVYFVATADNGFEGIFRTDGTSLGTQRLLELNSDNGMPYSISNLAVYEGKYYFTGKTSEVGEELWRSDGTVSGTVLLKDINPGSRSSKPEFMTHYLNQLCFIADTDNEGRELWCTDGTASGTRLVEDVNPGSEDGADSVIGEHNNRLLFVADDGMHGKELWAYVHDVADLCPQDPAKLLPGVCGCGATDDDLNANGQADCLDSGGGNNGGGPGNVIDLNALPLPKPVIKQDKKKKVFITLPAIQAPIKLQVNYYFKIPGIKKKPKIKNTNTSKSVIQIKGGKTGYTLFVQYRYANGASTSAYTSWVRKKLK